LQQFIIQYVDNIISVCDNVTVCLLHVKGNNVWINHPRSPIRSNLSDWTRLTLRQYNTVNNDSAQKRTWSMDGLISKLLQTYYYAFCKTDAHLQKISTFRNDLSNSIYCMWKLNNKMHHFNLTIVSIWEKEKPLESIDCMGEIAASVLLTLFIIDNERCHHWRPLAKVRYSFSNVINVQLLIPEGQIMR